MLYQGLCEYLDIYIYVCVCVCVCVEGGGMQLEWILPWCGGADVAKILKFPAYSTWLLWKLHI